MKRLAFCLFFALSLAASARADSLVYFGEPGGGETIRFQFAGNLLTINAQTGTPAMIGNMGIGETVGIAFQPSTNALLLDSAHEDRH